MAVASAPDREHGLAGRADELALLRALDVRVAYVHGIAGIGKSALLQAFLAEARAADQRVAAFDCRTIEPTERGFLAAATNALGRGATLTELIEALAEPPSPVVITLDHYEVFRLMDTWLRQTLVPTLPSGVHLVLAGREPPVAAWFSTAGGADFRSLPLGPIDDETSRLLLEQRGFTQADAARLSKIARGNPLALTLCSAGVAEHPELELEDAATARVVTELARLYLAYVDDPLARRALEAASVVRRATEPLLAAMLDGADGPTAMQALLELPFVDVGRDGLVVHEAVREAVGGFLRGTNPVRHRQYRRNAWRELRDEVRDAPPHDLWRYTADMLYLIENPVVREAFFPSGAQPLAVEPARPGDAHSIAAIVDRYEGHRAQELAGRWWEEASETFSVTRDRDGVAIGFFSLLDTRRILPPLVDDPIVHAWAQHLRDYPLPKGQVALGLRRWLDAERGELPGAVQAACWLDVKRTYMALRPALRRMYVVVQDVPTYWPVVEKLGFRPIAESGVEIDGTTYTSVVLDFGPGSVDGWLAALVASELGLEDEPALDEQARELSVHGARVALTPLEFGLFQHLKACEGRTVTRSQLLHEVWGTDFTGGSNVVDAVVRSLRGKLGAGASAVETVRGSGYRLRPDWRAQLG